MKFTEALQTLRTKPGGPGFTVALACGFTTLHLRTFLEAHLQETMSNRPVNVVAGLYGDLAGTLEALAQFNAQAVAVAIEWPDLDPRLGYRSAGGWSPAALPDMVTTVRAALERIERALQAIPDSLRVAVSMPTLSLPPVFYTPAAQAGESEWALLEAIVASARKLAGLPNVAIVSQRQLEKDSPAVERLDLKADLFTGLPYTLAHADAMGKLLANLIGPAAPAKGIISDLDDTLWSGILGDAGVENVAWDLTSHAQLHGLYQQVLSALADQGVLVAIASKNSPEIVEKALERADILLPRDKIFPLEVHWNAKSASVSRILKTWNIAADSVVFVDDSPMELEEVAQAHPGIRCLRFPKGDYAAAESFLRNLRNTFGKARFSDEDKLRRESIRQGAEFQRLVEDGESAPEAFLAGMNPRMTIDLEGAARDPRVLDLVNKTNQFNLNGKRFLEPDWRSAADKDGAFVASIAYEDRFGPLGKIAVIAGQVDADGLHVNTWVMSCRAFARRIEHQCVEQIFQRFGVDTIHFDFVPTPRNGPTRDFFVSLFGQAPEGNCALDRALFAVKCPALYHQVSYVQ